MKYLGKISPRSNLDDAKAKWPDVSNPRSEILPIRWTRDQVSAIPMTSMTTNARCSLPQVLEEQPFILVFLDLNFKVY
ncbi:hypothetical protein AAG906_032396 [Vitis piasezkii]